MRRPISDAGEKSRGRGVWTRAGKSSLVCAALFNAATSKLVKKLAAQQRQLTFYYEAGPAGYGLHRLIKALGHECTVAASRVKNYPFRSRSYFASVLAN
jgi:transposase